MNRRTVIRVVVTILAIATTLVVLYPVFAPAREYSGPGRRQADMDRR